MKSCIPCRTFSCSAIFAMLALLCAISLPEKTYADSSSKECEKNRAALDRISREIEKLDRSKAPAEMARDLNKLIGQLISDLKEIKKDKKTVTETVNNWKKNLNKFAETLKEHKDLLPRDWTKLGNSLDNLSKKITKKVKDADKSSAGKALKDVNEAEKHLSKAINQLESIKTGLNAVIAYDKAMNGSATEQIEAFKFGFDQLKGKIGADEVPGLGEFLDAYSTALEGIARNVAAYEKAFNEKLKQADTALAGTGIDINALYIRPKSPRDKLIARLKALKDEKAKLEKEIAAAECDKPEIPADPCKDPEGEPEKMKKWVEHRTKTERSNYEAAQKVYEDDFMTLSRLSFNEPTDTPSDQESVLNTVSAELSAMQRGIKENSSQSLGSVWDAKRRINEIAAGLGVAQNQGLSSWNEINSFIDRLKPGLAKKQGEARKTSAAAYKESHAKWKEEFDRALQNLNTSRKKRDDLKAEYERTVGELLAPETGYKWNQDQAKIKQFDDCFPYLGKLRKKAAAQAPASKQPLTKEPTMKPISTVKNTKGVLPPRQAVLRFDNVQITTGKKTTSKITMEVAPAWEMNSPFPGLLPIHVYPGQVKVVDMQGDMDFDRARVHNWAHGWAQKFVVEFDNKTTAENSSDGLNFQIKIPKGAKAIRKITLYYSTGSDGGTQPLVWEMK